MIKAFDLSGGKVFGRPASTRKLLPWLGWKFSLLFPLALLGLAATLVFQMVVDSPGTMAFRVVDDVTGKPVPGALVRFGSQSFTTDTEGIARIPSAHGAQEFTVASNGFAEISGSLAAGVAERQQVRLPKVDVGSNVAAAPVEPQLASSNAQPVEGAVAPPPMRPHLPQ